MKKDVQKNVETVDERGHTEKNKISKITTDKQKPSVSQLTGPRCDGGCETRSNNKNVFGQPDLERCQRTIACFRSLVFWTGEIA